MFYEHQALLLVSGGGSVVHVTGFESGRLGITPPAAPAAPEAVGTQGSDLMVTDTDTPFTAAGGAGGDVLAGAGGDDELNGGDQADLLLGAAGDDTLLGGGGRDTVFAGAGDDLVLGTNYTGLVLGDADTRAELTARAALAERWRQVADSWAWRSGPASSVAKDAVAARDFGLFWRRLPPVCERIPDRATA